MGKTDTLDLVRSKNKTKSFFIYTFMVISLLAIGSGIYYAIFTPERLSQKITEQKPIPPVTLLQESPTDDSLAIKKDDSLQLETAPPVATTPIVPITPPVTTAPIEQNMQSLANTTAENTLFVSDMEKAEVQVPKAPKKTNAITAKLTPPPIIRVAPGFAIPSASELINQREQETADKLRMLQEAKENQVTLAESEKQNLPGAQQRLKLSNQMIKYPTQDPVITDVFINSLAYMLVDNYATAEKAISNNYGLNATKISQHFGTSMEGLVHLNGRQGIFEYIYQPERIQAFSQFIEPRLTAAMNQIAKTNGFSQEQEQKMFHHYAKLAKDTAIMLNAIINTTSLDKHIKNYTIIEQQLREKKKEFAGALIGFEIAKQNRQDTKRFEAKLSQIAREANIVENNLSFSRHTLIASISKNAPTISDKAELFDLSLWVYRRNNNAATSAAVKTLDILSSLLSAK